MHIGFDISQTGPAKAGCGYFADAMAEALLEIAPQHRYALYPGFGDFFFDPLMPLRGRHRGSHVRYGPRHLTRDAAAAFWNRPDLEAALGHPDVVHANNYWCPTQLRASRVIYTCYDLGFTVDPRWTTEANRAGCFDGVFRSAVAADWIVAISAASRAHFLDVFPHFPADRIRVIHPASRFARGTVAGRRPAAAAQLQPGRFWLSVGTIEPRKNQLRLAQAYARYLALGGPPMPIVFAGGKGWLMDDFGARLESLGIARHALVTGYVSDAELAWLYGNCYAHLFPSLFEGFGLPVLEGMQFGAATVAANTSSLPEVAGDAGVLLDPDDTQAWAGAMLGLASDAPRRERLGAAARERARGFDREASVREMLALYEEALAAPKRTAQPA